jgi:hypothetical protein
MTYVPDSVRALERDLREIFGGRLQSVVAYGASGRSAPAGAHDDDGAHRHAHPLAHTLAITETLTADDLRACARRATKWHEAGLATPLLLAAHEFENSLDAFPLEFGAIVADHTMVSGKNPFDAATIDAADLRRACEVQARSHLLHLRQGYVEAHDNPDALAVLIVDSAPAFAGLLHNVARLQGVAADDAAAVGRHVERTLNAADTSVSDVIGLAGVTEISSADAIRIFPGYLDAVERLVKFADGWGGSR